MFVDKITPIVQQAGNMVMSRFRKDFKIHYKTDGSFCTDADLVSEQFLKSELQALIPGSGFIAEESTQHNIQEYTWVIDPIDGTKNFARGIPYFGINVGLMHGDRVIAAVTYMPAMGDMFWAQAGHGSWLNGQRLSIQDEGYVRTGALIVISAARLRQEQNLAKIKGALTHLEHGVRFRVCGAAAVDLAYAAAGSYDVVMFEGLKWWDAAAGTLLVTEAGGYVSDYHHQKVTPAFKTLIAGNPSLCKAVLSSY